MVRVVAATTAKHEDKGVINIVFGFRIWILVTLSASTKLEILGLTAYLYV